MLAGLATASKAASTRAWVPHSMSVISRRFGLAPLFLPRPCPGFGSTEPRGHVHGRVHCWPLPPTHGFTTSCVIPCAERPRSCRQSCELALMRSPSERNRQPRSVATQACSSMSVPAIGGDTPGRMHMPLTRNVASAP